MSDEREERIDMGALPEVTRDANFTDGSVFRCGAFTAQCCDKGTAVRFEDGNFVLLRGDEWQHLAAVLLAHLGLVAVSREQYAEKINATCEGERAGMLFGDLLEMQRRLARVLGVDPAEPRVDDDWDELVAAFEQRESLESLMEEIVAWQRIVFPHATPASISEHLRREAEELAKAPEDGEEMADVFFLLAGLVRSPGTLAKLVRAKFEKNKLRTWGRPDAQGVVEHVREAGE